jgi:hypothetical protein
MCWCTYNYEVPVRLNLKGTAILTRYRLQGTATLTRYSYTWADVGTKSVIAIKQSYIYALSQDASTLKRKVIAFYSYRSRLVEIVIAPHSYRSSLVRIVLAAYSYCSE